MPSAPLFTGRERLILPEDYSPQEDVVIIGRGKKVQNHLGNIRFRNMVDSYLDAYKGAATKGLKSSLLWNILTQVRANSKGNLGFVKKDPETGRWCAVDDANARINIAQAFRDRLSNSYRSSKQHKSIKRKHDLGLINCPTQQDCLLDENVLAALVNLDAKKFHQDASSLTTPNEPAVQTNKRICVRTNSVPSSMPSATKIIDATFGGRIQSNKSSMSMGKLADILSTASKVTSSCTEPIPKVASMAQAEKRSSSSSLSDLLMTFEASVECSENPFEPIPIAAEEPATTDGEDDDVVMTPMMALLKAKQQDMFEPFPAPSSCSSSSSKEEPSMSLKSALLDFNESDLFLQLDDCLEFVASSTTWNTQPEPLFSS